MGFFDDLLDVLTWPLSALADDKHGSRTNAQGSLEVPKQTNQGIQSEQEALRRRLARRTQTNKTGGLSTTPTLGFASLLGF